MLTEAQIIKFQNIYERQFGKSISRELAMEYGLKLLGMMQVVYSPIPRGTSEKALTAKA